MSQIVIPSPPPSTGSDDCDGVIIIGSQWGQPGHH
jgi:hypothetical protein